MNYLLPIKGVSITTDKKHCSGGISLLFHHRIKLLSECWPQVLRKRDYVPYILFNASNVKGPLEIFPLKMILIVLKKSWLLEQPGNLVVIYIIKVFLHILWMFCCFGHNSVMRKHLCMSPNDQREKLKLHITASGFR